MPDRGLTKLQSYLYGSGATLIAQAFLAAAGLAMVWLLNRVLGKADFGQFILALTAVQLITLVASAGLHA